LTQRKVLSERTPQHGVCHPLALRTNLSPPSKERILRAASVQFAQQGFHGTTVRDIAKAVNLHPPSIYHFFENKEALYLRCVDAAFERTAGRLRASLDPSAAATGARAQLISFVAILCDSLASDAELRAFVIQRHRQGSPWLAGTHLHDVIRLFADMLSNGAENRHDPHFTDRLMGLALGDALGRSTESAPLPKVEPAGLLDLVSPNWREDALRWQATR
jgi:AcrR family transcriptional regulator